eukprot:SAG31_NODE_6190_length_2130_cov_1.457410_2_plen_265_part_00
MRPLCSKFTAAAIFLGSADVALALQTSLLSRTQTWDTDLPILFNTSGAPVLNSGQRTATPLRDLALTVVRGDEADMTRKAWATCSARSRFSRNNDGGSPRAAGAEAPKCPVDDPLRVMTWNLRLRWGQNTPLTSLDAAEAIESSLDIYCAEMLRELQENDQGEGWKVMKHVSSQEGTVLSPGETLVALWQQEANRRVLYQWQFIPVKVLSFMFAQSGRTYKDIAISDVVRFAPTPDTVIKVKIEGGVKEYEALGATSSECCIVS